jgi:TonB family protein
MGYTPDTPRNHFCTLASVLRRPYSVLLLAVPTIAAAQGLGSVHGVVRDSLGGAVMSASVSIDDSLMRTSTDSAGAYRITGIGPGSAVLRVRRLGYHPASVPITIVSGSELEANVELSPVPEQLAPVEVRRRPEVYESRLAGFNERKSKHVGYFVTREKLDRMNSARFVDALRDMPGVSLRTLRGGIATVSLRGSRCAPVFYMDGFPARAGVMDLDMIDLSGVEGIEVYAGMSSIPAQFMSVAGGETCGVIAVWSRPFRPKSRKQEPISHETLERLVVEQTVYTADQVTQPATPMGRGLPVPVYPESLYHAGVPGRVVAEFIVGEDGRIEDGSVAIASATHADFATAVRSALEGVVFRPALLDGNRVRQVVQVPFSFDPSATPDSTSPPP